MQFIMVSSSSIKKEKSLNAIKLAVNCLTEEDMLHKHITTILKDSTLHQVVLDEVPLLNVKHRINGRDVVANETPIYHEGKLVGAVSVFQETTKLNHTLNLLDQKEVVQL